MRKILFALLSSCVSALFAAGAAGDCSGSPDACKAPVRAVSPFMAEVKKAEKAAELKQGKSAQEELKQAPEALIAAPSAQIPSGAGGKQTLSKPGWLPFVLILLAGLYYFLKRRRK